MTNIEPEAACVVIPAIERNVRLLSIGFLNISTIPTSLPSSRSLAIASWISVNSTSISTPVGLSHFKALRPSSTRPCKINQRGDSGMKNMPTARKNGMTFMIPSGIR